MSLYDRLQTLETADPPNLCGVARILGELDNDTASMLKKVLQSKVSTMTIHRELRQEGFKIARDSISNHRKGHCKCSAVEA